MRPYEIMLILESSVDEETVDGVISRVRELIAGQKGATGQVEKWGRRRFAYELKHRWEGYYALLQATLEPAAVAELDRVLTLSDDVIRHKIIRIPESVAGRARSASNTNATEDVAESTGAMA